MKLHRLHFSRIRDTNPDRWDRAEPRRVWVNKHDENPAQFLVRIQGGDWHECALIQAMSHPWGRCDCDGWQYHDGPCSHLIGLWRMLDRDEIPQTEPHAVEVDVRDPDTEQAQIAAEPDRPARADGGRR